MEVLRDINFVSKGLSRILERFGENLIENPERLNIFWMDIMPIYDAERKLVIKAVELKIAREIFAVKDKKRDEQVNVLKFYRKRLMEELFLTEEAVDYILDVLATAAGMGSLSKALAAEKLTKKLAEEAARKAAATLSTKNTAVPVVKPVVIPTPTKESAAKPTPTPAKPVTTIAVPKKEPAKTTPMPTPTNPVTTTAVPKKEPAKPTPTPKKPTTTTTATKQTSAKQKEKPWEVQLVEVIIFVWSLALFVWYVVEEVYGLQDAFVITIVSLVSVWSLFRVRKGSKIAALFGFMGFGMMPFGMALDFYNYIFDWSLDYGGVTVCWFGLGILLCILAHRIDKRL